MSTSNKCRIWSSLGAIPPNQNFNTPVLRRHLTFNHVHRIRYPRAWQHTADDGNDTHCSRLSPRSMLALSRSWNATKVMPDHFVHFPAATRAILTQIWKRLMLMSSQGLVDLGQLCEHACCDFATIVPLRTQSPAVHRPVFIPINHQRLITIDYPQSA